MSVLSNKSVYLSGPIEHGHSINWRTEIVSVLEKKFGLNVFDPFNDPKQQWKSILEQAKINCDFQTMHNVAKSFVRKDLCLVDRADFLIAYLPYKVPTCGTIHEIINSSNAKKPTLLVCPEGKQNIPVWLYGIIPYEVMFSSWDDMYQYLHEVESHLHEKNNRWSYVYGLV